MINQIEMHPFDQQIEVQKFLTKNGIQIESRGPFAEGNNNIFKNEILTTTGGNYNKYVAQMVLRRLSQRGVVVIPKTVKKERMKEYFEIRDFELNSNDLEAIATLDMKSGNFSDHRDPEIVK